MMMTRKKEEEEKVVFENLVVQAVLIRSRGATAAAGPAMDGVKRNMDKLQTSLVVSRTKGTSAGDENLTYELPTTGNHGM